jgi:hypothetical protein
MSISVAWQQKRFCISEEGSAPFVDSFLAQEQLAIWFPLKPHAGYPAVAQCHHGHLGGACLDCT